MKFTISNNPSLVDIAKRAIETLVVNLNIHLDAWGKTTLPNIKADNLAEFAANPQAYFDKALTGQAKEKGLEGVVPNEYAKLFNIQFVPNLQKYPMDVSKLEFVKLAKGNKAAPVTDYLEKVKDVGTITVEDPKQIEAAKMILDTFKKFTYISSLLYSNGSGMVQTAGTERIGFSLMSMGNLSPENVANLATKMVDVPMEQWEQKLMEQFNNPGLLAVNT